MGKHLEEYLAPARWTKPTTQTQAGGIYLGLQRHLVVSLRWSS